MLSAYHTENFSA